MKNTKRIMIKLHIFLTVAIAVLCAGFIFISCGEDPQLKVQDSDTGQFALDFTNCPISPCQLNFSIDSQSLKLDEYKIGNKEITLESWINPKATSTSIVFSRADGAGGVSLQVAGIGGNTTQVIPQFTINRLVTDPNPPHSTSTASYVVSGSNVLLNAWSHIAGLIVDADHSAVAGHQTCSGAESETPHLDIYINGVFSACATSRGVANDTLLPLGFAHEPAGNVATSIFQGIIDEIRLWTIDRTDHLATCKDGKLGFDSGNCGRLNDSLISYIRFNEGGTASTTADTQGGFGIGGLEYRIGEAQFQAWETGWTTDTPF